MQTYNVISTRPFIDSFPICIDASCVGSAFKNLLKIHNIVKIDEIILADQQNHWKANMQYPNGDNPDGSRRVVIGYDVFPAGYLGVKKDGRSVSAIGLNPIKQTIVNPFMNPLVSPMVSPLTESSVLSPFYPSVVYTPNNSNNIFNSLAGLFKGI